MFRLIKVLLVLLVLGFLGLAAYGYLVDLSPQPTEQRKPVSLNGS